MKIADIVKEYLTPVYNFARHLTGNAQDAEDVTQEVFIKVWKNLRTYDPAKPFRPWIFRIARNTALDRIRARKTIPLPEEAEEFLPDAQPLPDEVLLYAEEKRELDALIDALPTHFRDVVIFRYQHGMTFQEISEASGKPLDTVKSHHRRALILLRKKIGAPKT